MQHDQHDEQRLWVRFVSGDPLTRDEGERLTRWVDDADLKDAFLDDLQTDRELRSLGALAATEERFIEDTLDRLEREVIGSDAAQAPRPRFARPRSSVMRPVLAAAAAAFLGGLGLGLLRTPEPVLLTDQPFVSAVSTGGASSLPARLGAGPVDVPEGNTRLAFDSGTTLDVEGPARLQLVDEDELIFFDGRAEASVPADVAAFILRTPTTRMVESGATFTIAVEEHGETEVHLIAGELSVEPGRDGHWTGRNQRLSLDNLHFARAASLTPGQAESPVVFEAESDSGEFAGMIVSNRHCMEFGARETMQLARSRISQLISDEPERFSVLWSEVAPHSAPTVLRFDDGDTPPAVFRWDELHEFGHSISVQVTTDLSTEHGKFGEDARMQFHELTFDMKGLRSPDSGATQLRIPRSLQNGSGEMVLIDGRRLRFENISELKNLIEIRTEPMGIFGVAESNEEIHEWPARKLFIEKKLAPNHASEHERH